MSGVGVVVVGHGQTASHLVRAAKGIVAPGTLDGVIALDAGIGDSSSFTDAMCAALDDADQGSGVLMLIDLLGASPCMCGRREGATHEVVMLSGLNLAMLLKLSSLDRSAASPAELAKACAQSGQRAVSVTPTPGCEENV